MDYFLFKKSIQGYTIEFANSNEFRDSIIKSIPKFGEYAIEVGVLFLADSYAKSDIEYRGRSDEEILEELRERGLSSSLINSVRQIPINVEVARRYFLIVACHDII